jgi:DNA-binding response OmpR family regulator
LRPLLNRPGISLAFSGCVTDPLPSVLFVDEDEDALHRLLLRIEPLYSVFSLRTPSQIFRYIDRIRPEVVVLSDRLEYRKRDIRALLPVLRERFAGKIVILSEGSSEGDRALWTELGADGCFLHPTRERSRIDLLSRRIIDLAAEVHLRAREGNKDARPN